MEQTKLSREQTLRVANALPSGLAHIMREYPGLAVTGGFVRDTLAGLPPRDIDLLAGGLDIPSPVFDAQVFDRLGLGTKTTTDRAVTYRGMPGSPYPIQILADRRPADEAAADHDLTVCQAAVWFNNVAGTWMSYCSTAFLRDLPGKKLAADKPLVNPAHTYQRCLKLIGRGWTVDPRALLHIIAQIPGMGTGNVDEACDLIVGASS